MLYERPTLVVVQVGGLGGPAKIKAGFTRSAALGLLLVPSCVEARRLTDSIGVVWWVEYGPVVKWTGGGGSGGQKVK